MSISPIKSNLSQNLSQKRIFLYWLPLAASWLLMSFEMPFINGALARLAEAERMIAAFGIVAVISITIESPVISLLSTSTALSRTRQSYLQIRKFTLLLMILSTVFHFLVAWTSLFDLVVIDWMNAPEILHAPTKLGLKLMVFWSAAIGWRRFTQGILIRFDKTRFVGQGTVIRLISSAGTAVILASMRLEGIVVATIALETGVILEAIYAHWAAKNVIRDQLISADSSISEKELSYKDLLNFHWPLAMSDLLFLLSRPMISTALAYGLNPEIDLAAWPILSGILFISRAPALALPEVIIGLYEFDEDKSQLKKFSKQIGIYSFGFILLFSLTPLSSFYFKTLIGVNDTLSKIAIFGAIFGILNPPLTATISYFRGNLASQKKTLPITKGVIAELATLGGLLMIGVYAKLPGVPFAAGAIAVSLIADITTLYYSSLKENA